MNVTPVIMFEVRRIMKDNDFCFEQAIVFIDMMRVYDGLDRLEPDEISEIKRLHDALEGK